MQVVIDISEKEYENLKAYYQYDEISAFELKILHGTPLPKVLEDIKAKIKALPNVYPFYDHIDRYVKEEDVLAIIEADKCQDDCEHCDWVTCPLDEDKESK